MISSGKRYLLELFIVLVSFIILTSCSSSKNDVTQPSVYDDEETNSLPIVTSGSLDLGNSAYGVLGMYDVHIDTTNMTGEINELRQGAKIGDFYVVDITNYLTARPCKDCLKISKLFFDNDGRIVVTFGMKHPYSLPQPWFPLYLNRKDLHVFDVQGIVFIKPQESSLGITKFGATRSDIDGQPYTPKSYIQLDSRMFLANAYGYTSMLDNLMDTIYPTDFNVHPFKIFFEYPFEGNFNPNSSLTGFASVDSPIGYNIMRMGSAYSYTDYIFKVNVGENFDFLMVVNASYGQSARGIGENLGERLLPRYFCPQFNRKEAWKAYVTIENNNLLPQSPTSKADVVVHVRDWQASTGRLVSSTVFDPMTSRAGDYTAISKVREVTVDIPGLTYNKDADPSTLIPPYETYLFKKTVAESGSGSESNPLKYRVQVQNIMGAGLGTYMGLAAIRDELEGAPISIGLEGDGITTFNISDFTTYVPFHIEIKYEGSPFDPTQQTIPYTNSVMQYIRFDRHNVAQQGNDLFIIYRGTFSGIDSIWSQRSSDDGATWGLPQQISNHTNDVSGKVKVIACGVNAIGEPICAWVDGLKNIVYTQGSKVGATQINWGLNRISTGFRNQATNPDLAIDGHPYDVDLISILSNHEESTVVTLYQSTNGHIDYVGDLVDFQRVYSDDLGLVGPRPYVDLEIDPEKNHHCVFQIDKLSKSEIVYFKYYSIMIEPKTYVANESVLGRANWPNLSLTNQYEPVVVWEDEGSFSTLGTDIVTSYLQKGSDAFNKPLKVNNDDAPISCQYKPDIAVDTESNNAYVIYEDERFGAPQSMMTVLNVSTGVTLIDDFTVNTDYPTYHAHHNPQITMFSIGGYFPFVHAYWLDYGGPSNPFIGHNKT